jgi:hypothetical protein
MSIPYYHKEREFPAIVSVCFLLAYYYMTRRCSSMFVPCSYWLDLDERQSTCSLSCLSFPFALSFRLVSSFSRLLVCLLCSVLRVARGCLSFFLPSSSGVCPQPLFFVVPPFCLVQAVWFLACAFVDCRQLLLIYVRFLVCHVPSISSLLYLILLAMVGRPSCQYPLFPFLSSPPAAASSWFFANETKEEQSNRGRAPEVAGLRGTHSWRRAELATRLGWARCAMALLTERAGEKAETRRLLTLAQLAS